MQQWDDVRFFLAVARHRTLSGAARALRVDHATVGRRLVAFEQQLGSRLFDRTPEGFSITAAGQTILSQCETMENAASSVDRLVAGHDESLSGLVRVATTEGFARMFIVPALVTLLRAHPQLQVELMASPVQVDIPRRNADIAVRLGRATEPDLVCRKLGNCGFALYTARSRVEARGRSAPKGQASVSYLGAPTWFGAALGHAPTALFSNSPWVQLAAVSHRIGVGAFPCFLGDSDPSLQRVSRSDTIEPRPVWMILHRDLRRVAKIRLVANAVADAFDRSRHLLRHGSRKAHWRFRL